MVSRFVGFWLFCLSLAIWVSCCLVWICFSCCWVLNDALSFMVILLWLGLRVCFACLI